MAEDNLFTRSIDQKRLDKLRGAIVAFVSDFEQEEGFTNGEVARALVWAALYRYDKEDPASYRHFMLYLQKMATDAMAEDSALIRQMAEANDAKKIN